MCRQLVAAVIAGLIVVGCAASAPPTPPPTPQLPTSVAGVTLYVHPAVPAYYASPPPGNAWITILNSLGRKWSDILWAGGTRDTADTATATIDVDATEVRDVSAAPLLGAYGDWARGARPTWQIAQTTIGGRTTLRVTVAGSPRVLLAHASGNVLYEISAPDEATAETLLASLP